MFMQILNTVSVLHQCVEEINLQSQMRKTGTKILLYFLIKIYFTSAAKTRFPNIITMFGKLGPLLW